jgi:aspartate kinase
MIPQVVMKFGGTSLGTPEALAQTVAHVLREPRERLVVVSALGGVTDLLLRAAGTAAGGTDPGEPLQKVLDQHRRILDDQGLDRGLLSDLEDQLRRLLQGIALLRELSPRIQDEVLSLGERMSARLLAAAIIARGQPARAHPAWDLGLVTGDAHGCAEPLPQAYAAIRAAVEALDRREVPVVTGFLGRSRAGEITTLGRGGSDYSASIFAAAAGARWIQIWTDVPGILRADPRLVPGAEVIPAIDFEEAAELAFFGAKVLHPRTIEPARANNIPVRVLGTFQVDTGHPASQQGTLITHHAPPEPVRALALQREVQSLQVRSLRMLEAPGFLARVFAVLARHAISVNVIATSEVSVSMTFDRAEDQLPAAVDEIAEFAEVELFPRRCLLCVVGAGLRKDASLLARVFNALARGEVPVHVISQGASRINVTLVTDPAHAPAAMQALHAEFFGSTAP